MVFLHINVIGGSTYLSSVMEHSKIDSCCCVVVVKLKIGEKIQEEKEIRFVV
jgi:uncharacterized membrane-anchored protein